MEEQKHTVTRAAVTTTADKQQRILRFVAKLRENGKPVAATLLQVTTPRGEDFETESLKQAVAEQSVMVLRNLFLLEVELMPEGWAPGPLVLPKASGGLVDSAGRRIG